MRKQMVREGTTGLMVLAGLGVFGILFLWLRGFGFGQSSYTTVVEFENVGRMREGATVRYRGVEVGRIIKIKPEANSVDVTLEISPADLIIPSDVLIEANQSGIVGESSVDLTPQKALPARAQVTSPLDPNCDSSVIICDGSRLKGETGISYDELLRSTIKASELFANPEFFGKLDSAVEQVGNAAEGVNKLSGDLSELTISANKQLKTFSETAKDVGEAADQITVSTAQITDRLTVSTTQIADQLNSTTAQANQLLAKANRLMDDMNNIVSNNRSSIVTTLKNIEQTSEELRVAASRMKPIINQVEQGDLVANIEVLSANAAEASANLRDISKEVNNPTNLLMLQQTLDSARSTFQNVQKITSDVEGLTGDPVFINNLRNLVNGLSGLVSVTEELEQQLEVAHMQDRTPMNQDIKSPVAADLLEVEMTQP